VEQNTSKGAAAAMAEESAPNLKGKESERERGERRPHGQRGSGQQFSHSARFLKSRITVTRNHPDG